MDQSFTNKNLNFTPNDTYFPSAPIAEQHPYSNVDVITHQPSANASYNPQSGKIISYKLLETMK